MKFVNKKIKNSNIFKCILCLQYALVQIFGENVVKNWCVNIDVSLNFVIILYDYLYFQPLKIPTRSNFLIKTIGTSFYLKYLYSFKKYATQQQ